MSVSPTPAHLNNHHRDTLEQIFQHPVSHNIEWRAVLSLLETVAYVSEHADGRFQVRIGDETEVLDRPKGKDIDTQLVVDLRRMLRLAGYGPQAEDGADDGETPPSS